MEVTLLSSKQLFGNTSYQGITGDDALETMKHDELRMASLTDMAFLLGGARLFQGKSADGKPAALGLWTKEGATVNKYNFEEDEPHYSTRISARPALSAEDTARINKNNIKPAGQIEGFETVFYGEFPQSVETDEKVLNFLKGQCFTRLRKANPDGGVVRLNDFLKETGKTYSCLIEGEEKDLKEYAYAGKKYVRVYSYRDLINGNYMPEAHAYWVKVEPIEWVKDPSGVWFSKQALLTRVPYNEGDDSRYSMNIKKSTIYQVLQKFGKMAFSEYENNQQNVVEKRLDKLQERQDVLAERTGQKTSSPSEPTTHDSNSSTPTKPNGRDDGGR